MRTTQTKKALSKWGCVKLKSILLLLLLPLFVQCASQKAPVQGSEAAVQFDKEQVWQLVSLQGKPVPQAAAEIVLMFHPESGTLRGRVACNRYFADYSLRLQESTAAGSRYAMDVKYVSGGDVQCPEGGMAEQERYLALLGKADACLLTATTLTLYRRGRETLKFELQ